MAAANTIAKKDTSVPVINIRERIDSIQQKYGIKLYIDTFDIDTSRAGIAPIEHNTKNKKANAKKDSLPNLIQPGLRKYTFNYLTAEDEMRRDSLLHIFFEEWEKYPPDFVNASGLKAVYFIKNLKVQGQARYAMPEGVSSALYYDVNFVRVRPDEYLRHSMHHEFYHLIERNYFGNFYYRDKTWMFFNPLDFTYGSGGATAYGNPEFSRRRYPYKGFVTGYATVGIEEDKAEVFAYLMTTSEFVQLYKWIKEDQALASKVAYFMGFLRGISREMDYDYFLRIHGIKTRPVSIPVIRNDLY